MAFKGTLAKWENPEIIYGDTPKPSWEKDFPVIGQGTFIFNIQRKWEFYIVIRPKLADGVAGADNWIVLIIRSEGAAFYMYHKKKPKYLVHKENIGYESDSKISYWFSYDRDRLVIKYGKGYIMEQTTLLEHDFLKGATDPNAVRRDLQYLFSPTTRRRVQLYDGHVGSGIVSQSMIDIEGMVDFDKLPFVSNWSPFIMDSSKVNLFVLDKNDYTFSANLPRACLQLYSLVTAPNVDIDWSLPSARDNYPLSNAIRHSIVTPGAILHEKLKAIEVKYGSKSKTFLKVTMEQNHGNSLFYPVVMEIWPAKHGSPIHNHGNSCAIIRVIHGGLTIRFYNKQTDSISDTPLSSIDVKKGDCTWISPNWYQTHKLWNHSEDFCATLQCYQYGEKDLTHWPYFDYVAHIGGNDIVKEARGTSDFMFGEFHDKLMHEYGLYMDGKNGKKNTEPEL